MKIKEFENFKVFKNAFGFVRPSSFILYPLQKMAAEALSVKASAAVRF